MGSGAITLGQNERGSNGNERVLYIFLKFQDWSLAIIWFSVISRILLGVGGVLLLYKDTVNWAAK